MPLKTLEEHNREASKKAGYRGNGIACPSCGNELCDKPVGLMMPADPSQYPVFCSVCQYIGFRR